jgi:hypothetical protein
MTLLIKQGRRYRRRDGKIAGPMEVFAKPVFTDPAHQWNYNDNGTLYHLDFGQPEDLLTELEEPSSPESVEGWSVPKGWKLVPIEPTVAMKNAAIDVDSFKLGDISPLGFRMSPQKLFKQCYAAMLDAAPLPPSSKDKGSAI